MMMGVPAPPVMEPFVIDQAYVAPAPAFGTDALLPAEVAQTADDVVIVADGSGLKTTVVHACMLPPHGQRMVRVTTYVPATVMPVGFCSEDVKPPGPVQEKIEPVPVAKRLPVDPAQAGPLLAAVANGAAVSGQTTSTVAMPLIEAVTISVAVIICEPGELNETLLKVCVPLSPATKV